MISLLAAELALSAWGLEFAVARGEDLGLPARQHLARRDESDGTVQPDLVVSHTLAIQAPRISAWVQPKRNGVRSATSPPPARLCQILAYPLNQFASPSRPMAKSES